MGAEQSRPPGSQHANSAYMPPQNDGSTAPSLNLGTGSANLARRLQGVAPNAAPSSLLPYSAASHIALTIPGNVQSAGFVPPPTFNSVLPRASFGLMHEPTDVEKRSFFDLFTHDVKLKDVQARLEEDSGLLEVADSEGKTALHRLCIYSRNSQDFLAILELFLAQKPDLELQDLSGKTAFGYLKQDGWRSPYYNQAMNMFARYTF